MTAPDPVYRMPIDQVDGPTAIAILVVAVVLVGLWSVVANRATTGRARPEDTTKDTRQKEAS